MGPYRIGIQLASLRQPFRRALATAAEVGADAVEIDARGELRPSALSDTGLRQLRKMLDDLRLKVSAVSFSTRRGYDVVDDMERRIAATKQAMNLAYALGSNVVTNSIGSIPDDADDPAWHVLHEALVDIGRHGQHCGAWLAARTGGEDAGTLRRFIDSLPEGSLAVDFDPGALIVNGFSADDALVKLGRDVVHVHARDGVRDLARGRGLEVPLGRGSVDFSQLLASLEQYGYRGYLTIERHEADDPFREISNAVNYLREIQR